MTSSSTAFAAIGRIAAMMLLVAIAATAVVVAASAMSLLPMGRIEVGDTLVTLGLNDTPLERRLLWGTLASLVLLVTLALSTRVVRGRADRAIVISGRRGMMFGGGTVAVSERSLVALSTYAAERVDGVLEASTRIKLTRRGWYLDVWIVLTPDAELQVVVQALKIALHDSLRSHTGLSVGRMRVWAQLEPLAKRRRVY